MIKEQTVKAFLADVAGDAPTPGGGSVAAITGAMAAALVEMVVSLTKKNKDLKRLGIQAKKIETRLLALADRDADAFKKVIAAYRLPKANKARENKIQEALKLAAKIPLNTAELSNQVLSLAKKTEKAGNKNALSDSKVAKHLARASIFSAVENVEINLAYIKNTRWKENMKKAIATYKDL